MSALHHSDTLRALSADIDRLMAEKVSTQRIANDCCGSESDVIQAGEKAARIAEQIHLALWEFLNVWREANPCAVHGDVPISGCCERESAA